MQLVLPVKKGKAPTEFSSGQTGFSPDGKTFLAICENTYSSGTPSLYVFPAATPGGLFILCISKILRQAVITLQQIHFGSQCATEDVYRHLLAKVELKKSHFGKTPLTECALCHLPCQSELAEATKIYIERKTRQEK